MVKKMSNNMGDGKNLQNKGNSKGFRKGTEPETFGESAETSNYGGDEIDIGNTVGGYPDPNKDRGNTKDRSLIRPRDPVLNAVPMPNNTKMNKRDKSVLTVKRDAPDSQKWEGTEVPVGGVPMPNTIR